MIEDRENFTPPTTHDLPPISLILLAHGSKDPKWCKSFEDLAKTCDNTSLAYMDLIEPSLFSVTEELSDKGIKNIKILPMFMSSGGHVDKDIPEQVKELKVKFPKIDFEILPPIGKHPKVISSMKEIIKEYAK